MLEGVFGGDQERRRGEVWQGGRFMGEWGEVWFWREDVGVVSVVVDW